MPSIPVWLTGPGGGYTVSITPQTVAANGALTNGTASTLTGDIDEITPRSVSENDEISAMTSPRHHNVPVKVGTQMTLVEILKANGANLLAAQAYTASYFKVIVTRGGQTYTFYGLIQSYEESLRKGKSTGTLALDMVDPGTANPTYA